MPRENEAVSRFVKQLNAAFGSRMAADARDLYYQELCKWSMSDRAWERALSLITTYEDLDRVPSLSKIYDYLLQAEKAVRGETPGIMGVTFSLPDGRRYCRWYHVGVGIDETNTKGRVPLEATNVRRFPASDLSNKADWEADPSAYPDGAPTQDGTYFKVSEHGMAKIQEITQRAIEQHVQEDLDAYRAKLIVLTQGKRGSMRKRELDPLEAQAREWAKQATESEIAEARIQATEILKAKFANVKSPEDLVAQTSGSLFSEPSDYDDSDIAIGRQRLAQMERFNAAEKKRETDLSDV